MYYFLSLIIGVIISAMISVNGDLSLVYGEYYAAVIIHVVGVSLAFLICVVKKEKIPKNLNLPVWAYLGGAIGVLSTFFNNFSFGRISMTNIVALGLLGQSVTSVVIDTRGWFGMTKHPIKRTALVGFLLAFCGIGIMLDSTITNAMIAVIISFGAGVTVVLSRTFNSKLSQKTSAITASFINHLVGLPICATLAIINQSPSVTHSGAIHPWVYCGGMLGVFTVCLFNITVPKIPAFHLTMLSFIGQFLTGIVLDWFSGKAFSGASFWGGMVIATGLFSSMIVENLAERKREKERTY